MTGRSIKTELSSPETPMRIAVIIVHYHTGELLTRAVESLLAESVAHNLELELIVVDNGSDERSRLQLSALPVTMLRPGKNVGYGAGLNLGVARTDAEFLLMMNADIEVLPGCLAALIKALKDGAAVTGPRLYLDTQRKFMLPPTEQRNRRTELLSHLAHRHERWALLARRRWRRHARLHWLATQPIASNTLSGAMLAMHRRAWEQVGPFDERYRLYFEETDWLLRMTRAGLLSYYVPQAEAVHFYNQSAVQEPGTTAWAEESARTFKRQYYGELFSGLLPLLLRPFKAASLPLGEPLCGASSEELNLLSIESDGSLWVELAVSPIGLPAAAALIRQAELEGWEWPASLWEFAAPGRYYLRIVDGEGRELRQLFYEQPGKS